MFTDENDSIKRHLRFANNPDASRYFIFMELKLSSWVDGSMVQDQMNKLYLPQFICLIHF